MSTEAAQRVADRYLAAATYTPLIGLKRRAEQAKRQLKKMAPKMKWWAEQEDDPEDRRRARDVEIVGKMIKDVRYAYTQGENSVRADAHFKLKAMDKERSPDRKRFRKLKDVDREAKRRFDALESQEDEHHRDFTSNGPTPEVIDAYVDLATRIVKVFDQYLAL